MRKLIGLLLFLFSINLIAQDTIAKPQLSIISLDKVKVVYRGIDNPITVAVPNAKEYWVSGPGVSKTDEIGKYIIRPGIGTELKIIVAIKLQDDSIVTEKYVYQIKGLPNLTTIINDQYSTQEFLIFTLDELKDAKLGISFIDFLFKFNLEIVQYTIEIPNGKTLIIKGNMINKEAIDFIKKVKNKKHILITDLKANWPSSVCLPKQPNSIAIQIIK